MEREARRVPSQPAGTFEGELHRRRLRFGDRFDTLGVESCWRRSHGHAHEPTVIASGKAHDRATR